jgi:hypothetical protein
MEIQCEQCNKVDMELLEKNELFNKLCVMLFRK